MKIFLVAHESRPLATAIARHMADLGHRVVLATTSNADIDRSQIRCVKIGNPLDRVLHKSMGWLGDSHLMHSTRATARLLDIVAEQRPDVVHIVDIDGDYLNLPLMAYVMQRYRVPTVLTVSHSRLIACDEPAMIKRHVFNFDSRAAAFAAWDMLHIVAADHEIADRASVDMLEGHPMYVIGTDNEKEAAMRYADLYAML